MPVKEDTSQEVVEHVGGYELRIVPAEETAESRRRWEQRGEALAAWLLRRWREQHAEGGN